MRVQGNPASKHTWHVSNAAPVAASQVLTTAQNVNLPVTLQANDEECTEVSSSSANQRNGVLLGDCTEPGLPTRHRLLRHDSFSFKADDGDATSNVATVSINVTPAPGQAGVERGTFVVFGQEGVILRDNVKVMSGDIAASLSSQGPWLGDGAEVSIGSNVSCWQVATKCWVTHSSSVKAQRSVMSTTTSCVDLAQSTATRSRHKRCHCSTASSRMPAIVRGKANVDVASRLAQPRRSPQAATST